MDPATAAVIVLLACPDGSSTCQEMRSSNNFASIEECREALKAVIARVQTAQQKVTGHCETLTPDAMVTGSIVAGGTKSAGSDEGGAILYDSQGHPTAKRMVHVTSHHQDKTVTRGFVVPSEP